MNTEYLDTIGGCLLRDLSKAGIFPSPNNYVGIEDITLDELAARTLDELRQLIQELQED